MNNKRLGIAVVGSGRIGTLRARLAAKHAAADFLAVSDIDLAKAQTLASQSNANYFSSDNEEIISHPDVNAVFVSTPENEHVKPICMA